MNFLQALAAAQLRGDIDQADAALARWGTHKSGSESVGLALLALRLAAEGGDARINLTAVSQNHSSLAQVMRCALPEPNNWLTHLRDCDWITSDLAQPAPFFLDEAMHISLFAVAAREQELRARLTRRLALASHPIQQRGVIEDINLAPAQSAAIQCMLHSAFSIISGGPGTGKTTCVAVAILRFVLNRAALGLGARVALCAPTGKAAERLLEALHAATANTVDDTERRVLQDALPTQSHTVHRLLRLRPQARDVPREPRQKIPYDMVVCDEASMLDATLAIELLEATPTQSHLIWLGDADQLPAINGGEAFRSALKLALAQVPARGVLLEHNFRQSGALHELAQAIRVGDETEFFALLENNPEIIWQPISGAAQLPNALESIIQTDAWTPWLHATTPAQAFAALGQTRVLCALREGPFGVAGINQLLAFLLAPRQPAASAYVVSRNNPEMNVYNGQSLLRWRAGDVDQAWLDSAGSAQTFATLADVEMAYATSVHRAQGSEYGQVSLVLPPDPHPLITRALLYTAVTRARTSLHLVASREALRAALTKSN
jgi:exodeoxyribonuclease V alpha subunit